MPPTPDQEPAQTDAPEVITWTTRWTTGQAFAATATVLTLLTRTLPYAARLALVALLGALIAVLAHALYTDSLHDTPMLLVAASLLLFPAGLMVGITHAFKQVFGITPSQAGLVEWIVDDRALRIMAQHGDAPVHLRWTELSRVVKSDRGYLLFLPNLTLPLWLPGDVFDTDDDQNAFDTLLRRKLGPDARMEL
ncbi:MAG: YcxB family protein [Myxococcota bacterium]